MAKLVLAILFLHLVNTIHSQELRILPKHFSYYSLNTLAVNGSSVNGNCSDVTHYSNGTSTCNTPSSSVLFDGHIPTLTGLDGNNWANELMILHHPEYGRTSMLEVSVKFSDSRSGRNNVSKLEVTIFNCPQWNAAIKIIIVEYGKNEKYHYYRPLERYIYPTVISCNSLVKMCISINTTTGPIKRLLFRSNLNFIYVAEIAFYHNVTACNTFTTIIPGSPPESAKSYTEPNPKTASTKSDIAASNATQENKCDSLASTKKYKCDSSASTKEYNCDSSASVQPVLSVLAVNTAVQTTVTFFLTIVVIFLLFKYNIRHKTEAVPEKPAEPVLAAMSELLAEDEDMYESVEPKVQKCSAKIGV